MPRNKTEDLRNHLFAALEEIAEAKEGNELETAIHRAKAVSGIAREINSSAKNEVTYLNILAKYGKLPDQGAHGHLLGKGKTSSNE